MRRDVRLLGEILGEVIRESDGQDLLDDVEDLRRRVIAARRHEPAAEVAQGGHVRAQADDAIAALVASWPVQRAEAVARAFSVYFHLANLAEEHQRIRTLRERDTGTKPVRESLAAAMAILADTIGDDQRAALIGRLEVHPVLTAHPTEARRRAVTEALRRIGAQLDAFDNPQLGAAAHAEARRRLREEIDLLWRTPALRSQAMRPLDEVRSGTAIFDETLFRLAPAVYRALDQALQGEASGVSPPQAPPFLRFGSWIGADRDGNPFVTATVTEQTAAIQADHALRALENATARIGRSLTLAEVLPAAPAGGKPGPGGWARANLAAALAVASQHHPALIGDLSSRSPAEPYRVYLLYLAQRLLATRLLPPRAEDDGTESDGKEGNGGAADAAAIGAGLAFGSAAEFVAALRLVQQALAESGAKRQAYGELQHLIWQAETFGFHLAELEIRQHSAVHAAALAELRAGRELSAQNQLSAQTQEVLATFRAIRSIQLRHGTEACRRYVVSFTTSAADISAVYELAEFACSGQPPVLDVVPLFESGDDLARAVPILDEMLTLDRGQAPP